MLEHVDNYCERVMPGFWDEPLNAVTNLSFIIAAIILWRLAARAGVARRPSFLIPTALLALTGVGSFLFHTLANGWTGLADTLALGFCLLATIYAASIRFLGWPWWRSLFWPVLMLGAAVFFGWLKLAPGSFYFGPLAAGTLFAALLLSRGHPAGRWIIAALLVFLPSFLFRTLDDPLCGSWPYGTHFLWHILNGIVLGLAIRPLAWGDRGEQADGTGRTPG